MSKKNRNPRLYFLSIFLLLAAGCISARLFSLQVIQHSFYSALAQGQHEAIQKLSPQRGEIFIQEKGDLWHPLAVNRNYKTVFLSPNEVIDKNEVAQKISPLVGISEEDILRKLEDPRDPYEPLKSKLDDETAEKISGLALKGVHLISEGWRWYPQGTLAANVLGFVGLNEKGEKVGRYGLEQFYDDELAGVSGFLKSEKDALGRWLLMGDYDMESAEDGASLYLTLDQNIQYILEQKMKALLEKWDSSGGCAIVMDPQTGAIKAMASFPGFDPNEYQKTKDPHNFINSCVQESYEPGSVFKPIVMAAGLDTNKVSPQTTFVDTGSVQIGSYIIRNAQEKTYGQSTMTQVLEKSINTGVIFVGRLIGGDVFKKYIEAFGFGETCEVDLASEAAGNISNLSENREINFVTAAYGQGVAVTPLQMISAISAIANEGKLMRPYVAEKIVFKDGREEKTEPKMVRQAITAQAAGKLTAMLVSTVRNGYDKIKIKGYFIAGKTGTAQIPSPGGGYLADETIHSFVGYAPAYNPKFAILLKMERPHGIQFASESLAPVFGELAQYLLNYYEISPQE